MQTKTKTKVEEKKRNLKQAKERAKNTLMPETEIVHSMFETKHSKFLINKNSAAYMLKSSY